LAIADNPWDTEHALSGFSMNTIRIRYDMIEEFNVDEKAERVQLILAQVTKNQIIQKA